LRKKKQSQNPRRFVLLERLKVLKKGLTEFIIGQRAPFNALFLQEKLWPLKNRNSNGKPKAFGLLPRISEKLNSDTLLKNDTNGGKYSYACL